MRPAWLAGAVALVAYGLVRRRAHGRASLAAIAAAAVVAGLVGFGVIPLPDVQQLIEDAGTALGPWTYAFVGVLAFLETGAFVGLVAPGETTVIVGGLVAGQGRISLLALIAIVWICAVAGDLTSYTLGRRLGRDFLIRHGARLKITEERVEHVEAFFKRRGGATILIGRFIGVVRSLAPFVAGTSRMPLARFLPYDVLGAGAWAATFSLLGYVFWRSFDQLTHWVSRGLAAFAALVVLALAIWFAVRLTRDGQLRRRTRARIAREFERPALRPFAPYARAAWRRVVRPLLHRAAPPARFVWQRLTPGELGLELTTLLALVAVGAFTFVVLGDVYAEAFVARLDAEALRMADRLHMAVLEAVAVGLQTLGSLPAVAVVAVATVGWALARGRFAEAAALAGGFLVCLLAVEVARQAFDRPPPARPLVESDGPVYPSAHAALAVGWTACAVVLVRGGHRLATRFATVAASVVLVAAIGLARVYLRADHLSDAVGGLALGTACFAAAGTVGMVVGFVRHNQRST
jgi:membrane protein DedA with SNARE-associated domain/membrane-associated phospholipid phosphatase